MPTGVRTPVVSMSMRALMGIVQALVVPGICRALSISATSSSQEIRSGHRRRQRRRLSQSGDQDEYQRSFFRHCSWGLSTTVVSIIENGAGSVEVSARPALPNTRSTSGKERTIWSCVFSRRLASVTLSPGSVVGM